jgi:hypothetical protein
MMTGDVIKSFLVGLGFAVDDASLAKFNKSIASATVRVTALYGSIKLATAGIVYGISKISEGFEDLGYEYKILAPALNKALILRREMLRAYGAAGVNLNQVVQSAARLNLSLTKTQYAFQALYRSVASRFFDSIAKQSDLLRNKLYANMSRVQAILERVVKFLFKAFEATTLLTVRLFSILERVYEFLAKLDKATGGWSTAILAAAAAWKVLNLSFLATPLGMLLTGLVALLALFDDFKTWQEGGKSFFNWSSFVPVIDSVTKAVKSILDVFQALVDVVANVLLMFAQLFQGDWSGAFDTLKESLRSVISLFEKWWDSQKNILGSLNTLLEWGGGAVGSLFGSNPQPNGGVGQGAILGANAAAASSLTNQTISQQTNINVQSTGKRRSRWRCRSLRAKPS